MRSRVVEPDRGLSNSPRSLAAVEGDLSTTMPYQRDEILHFAHYWLKFMLRGVADLIVYLLAHNKKRLAVSAIFGEALFVAVCAAGLLWRPVATSFVFILPFFVARFFMMWGNWGQHVRWWRSPGGLWELL